MASNKEYKLAVRIAGAVDKSLGSACTLTKKQLREIAREAADANKSSVSFSKAMQDAGPGIDAAWSGVEATVKTTVAGITAAATAVGAIGVASAGVGREFETAMSSWAATANATEEDFANAREAAMLMGKTTSKTATESANALEYMALAGWSVEDSIAGLPGVLRLSEATEMDLAKASDLVTDSMSALGIEVENLDGYLDVAAAANNKSNQTAQMLMEAYLGVGGTMKNLNVPIQESATALGILANRGIKGAEGGTALNAVVANLTTGTGKAGKMMDKLGISAFDSNGKFIGLKKTIETVDKATAGLTEEERNAALAAIGGKEHIDALNALMSGLNTTVADGASEWDNLETSLYNSQGALEKMAATKLDNLNGDLAIFQSALEDSGIRIYDSLQEPLRAATQMGTQLVYEFSDNVADDLKNHVPTIKRYMNDAGEALETFGGPLISVGSWMIDHPDVIAGGLAAIGTTITSLKLAQTITTTAGAVKALSAALASNPVTAAIGVAAVAGGAVVGLITQIKIADEKLKRQNLADHFGEISLSMEQLRDVAGQIIDNGNISKIGAAAEEFEKLDEFAENFSKNARNLERLNWKASMGLDLSETDYDAYERELESYINNAISIGEQKQYAMNLNLQLLTNNDESGQDIIDQFNSYYDGLNQELRDLGDQLGEAYSEGMKDGVLSLDEVETIQGLQKKMADITAKLSSSQFEAKIEALGVKYGGGELTAEAYQNLQSEIQAQVDEAAANLQESLTMNIAGAKLQLEDGAIDESSYQAMIDQFKANYLEQLGDIQLKASSFQTETLYQQYDEELRNQMPELANFISERMSDYLSVAQIGGNADLSFSPFMSGFSDDLSRDTKKAISELWDEMEPDLARLEGIKKQYLESGQEIPAELAKAISDEAAIGILAGSQDALWSYIGSEALSNEEYKKTLNTMDEVGYAMPEQISEGMKGNVAAVHSGVDSVYSELNRYAGTKAWNIPVRINMSARTGYTDVSVDGHHAAGGIFSNPHIGMVAEAGPEAIVPLDGSQNAASIWQRAGEILGLQGRNSGGTSVNNADNSEQRIVYSPTYQIYGNSEAEVRRATDDDYERFERLMERYQRNQRRLGF